MQTENTAQASSDSDPTMDSKPRWWTDALDERQRAEIKFAHTYASEFHHGTDGHHRLLLISALAIALDNAWDRLGDAEGITVKLHEELTRLRFITESDQDIKTARSKIIENLRHTIWELNPAHRDATFSPELATARTCHLLQGNFERELEAVNAKAEFAAIRRLESVLNAIDSQGNWHDRLAGFDTLRLAMSKAASYLMKSKGCTNGEAYAMLRAGMAVSERMQGINPTGHGY